MTKNKRSSHYLWNIWNILEYMRWVITHMIIEFISFNHKSTHSQIDLYVVSHMSLIWMFEWLKYFYKRDVTKAWNIKYFVRATNIIRLSSEYDKIIISLHYVNFNAVLWQCSVMAMQSKLYKLLSQKQNIFYNTILYLCKQSTLNDHIAQFLFLQKRVLICILSHWRRL